MKINNVVSSKYAKLFNKNEKNPFKLKAEFEACLNAIEITKSFQKKYKYLENIINSGDMKRKLQDSSFDKIDGEWKIKLNRITGNNITKIIDLGATLIASTKALDLIQDRKSVV